MNIKLKGLRATLFCTIFLIGCVTTPTEKIETGVAPTPTKSLLAIQDSIKLPSSNGKIVEEKPIHLKGKWADQVEAYRIKYLSDRLKVIGFIVKPKGEDSKYPVIIFNRGGNREFSKIDQNEIERRLALLAASGYAVFASQYRGNDGGQGREEFGGRDVNDVLNLIPLARSLPFTIAERIGMYGFSRGGMMTYVAIKEGADIRAAVVIGGITDLFQLIKERDDMRRVISELAGLDPRELKSRSACFWPEKISVPLLILHGQNDVRVDVSHAKNLAEKLIQHGKVYELVIFPGGDHGLGTHLEKRNKKILDWFNRYLR